MRTLRRSLFFAALTLAPGLARATPTRCLTPQLTQQSVTHRTHLVKRGDSLSVIALRYGASIDAVALANGLGSDRRIRIGQSLVVPLRIRPGGGEDWLKYARAPKRRGHVDLVGFKERFVGQVVEDGKLLPAAKRAISNLLGAKGTRPPVPDRLIRLLVRVSDTFGGRPLRVVSGYRTSSFYSDSHHKRSEAVDFSIPGVPNAILRQYLLLLDGVGVGYYPHSSFLHLDVRDCQTQWVDYSGPYEAPRTRPARTELASQRPSQPRPETAKTAEVADATDSPSESELDAAAREVTEALDKTAPSVARPASRDELTTRPRDVPRP